MRILFVFIEICMRVPVSVCVCLFKQYAKDKSVVLMETEGKGGSVKTLPFG